MFIGYFSPAALDFVSSEEAICSPLIIINVTEHKNSCIIYLTLEQMNSSLVIFCNLEQ